MRRGVRTAGSVRGGPGEDTLAPHAPLCEAPSARRPASWLERMLDRVGADGRWGLQDTRWGEFSVRGFLRGIDHGIDNIGDGIGDALPRGTVTIPMGEDGEDTIVITAPNMRAALAEVGRTVRAIGPTTENIVTNNVSVPIMTATRWAGWGVNHPQQAGYLVGQQLQRGANWISDHPVEYWSGLGYLAAGEAAIPEILAGFAAEFGFGGASALDDVGALAGLTRRQRTASPDRALVDEYSELVSNWGTGPVRPPRGVIGRNEAVLIDETLGLQSRTSGLFDDVVLGSHSDDATRYLYTVDERGINIAFEHTPFPTRRGFLVHSNLSAEASFGGEVWFGANNTVTINAGSGRFGYSPAGQTSILQYNSTIKLWESLGYRVTARPWGSK